MLKLFRFILDDYKFILKIIYCQLMQIIIKHFHIIFSIIEIKSKINIICINTSYLLFSHQFIILQVNHPQKDDSCYTLQSIMLLLQILMDLLKLIHHEFALKVSIPFFSILNENEFSPQQQPQYQQLLLELEY